MEESINFVFILIFNSFIYFWIAAIGFNVETVQYNNIKFQVWDLGNLSAQVAIF